MTDSSGNIAGQQGHYPFGEAWYMANTTTKWQFTSYERDAESGNDYALARYHVNRLGRFSSPDPLAGSVTDPQSLNRYAYVRNDPVNLTDPLGLKDCLAAPSDPDCSGGGGGGGCPCGGYSDDGGCRPCPAPLGPDPDDRFMFCELYGIGCPGGGAGGSGDPGGGGRGGVDPNKDKQDAIKRVLSSGRCLEFLAQLINKLFVNANAASSTPPTLSVLKSQAEVTQPPNLINQLLGQISRLTFDFNLTNANLVAITQGNNVSLNRANYSAFSDRPLVFIHESFHSDLAPGAGFGDIALARAAGRAVPSGLTGEAAIFAASRNFTDALMANCGK